MVKHDLCLAWNWEYDRDFVNLLNGVCCEKGLSLLSVTPEDLDACLDELSGGKLAFSTFLDRASESDPRFQPLVDHARQQGVHRLNPQELALWSADKATMHLEFVSRGLATPYTLLIPPASQQPDLPALDLSPLRGRFAIKPASLGGGEGVVLEAVSCEQVQTARWQHPQEKYLLQAQVTARSLDGRPAWFRLLFCRGALFPCWWDQGTHIYSPVLADEHFHYRLGGLNELARRIAAICGMDLFSTEICLTEEDQFLAVDYVNDPIDLRLQSRAVDGVPDQIVSSIARRLAKLAEDPPPAG
jgi:hypothetical protein